MRLRVAAGARDDRDFRPLFISQATSAFGDRLLPIALAFAVLAPETKAPTSEALDAMTGEKVRGCGLCPDPLTTAGIELSR